VSGVIMPDEETPPVRKLVLKPKEITRTDAASRLGDGTEISIRLMHKQNEIAEQKGAYRRATNPPIDGPAAQLEATVPSGFAPKAFDLTETRSIPGDGTEVSASLILQGNRIMEARHAPEIIAMPARRRSKRTRDFLLMVALIAGGVGGLQLMLPVTVGSLMLCLFLVVFCSAALAWILFGVMDDY
jgi:hypothetical protein